MLKQLLLSVALVAIFLTGYSTVKGAETFKLCSLYNNTNTPNTFLGAPYNILTFNKSMILQAACTEDSMRVVLGDGLVNHLIFGTVYAEFSPNQFTPVKVESTLNDINSSEWFFTNSAYATIDVPSYARGQTINLYAYMCQIRYGTMFGIEQRSLKCGCNEKSALRCLDDHGTFIGTWNHQRVTLLGTPSGTAPGNTDNGTDTDNNTDAGDGGGGSTNYDYTNTTNLDDFGVGSVEGAWAPPYNNKVKRIIDPMPYIERYDLPSCSSSDALIIESNADWSKINSSQYSVFCVKPGDYRGVGRINLTADGTSSKPRVIRLYNSDVQTDTHIVNYDASDLARVHTMHFNNANHWIIDRMFFQNGERPVIQFNNSDNNILNGLRVESEHGAVRYNHGSDNNHFQNGYVYRWGIGEETCFHWNDNGSGPAVAKYNSVINTEMRDCGDGVQPTSHGVVNGKLTEVYDGTKIIANDIYLTSDKYADCGSGRRTSSGQCACAENAIDIKVGGSASEPMLVKGNVMWGWRKAVPTCDGKPTSHSDWGAVMHAHHWAKDLIVEDNIMFDSDRGFQSVRHAKNIVVRNNLFYNIKTYAIMAYHDSTNCSNYRGFGNTSSCVMDNFDIVKNVIYGGSNWFSGGSIGATNSEISCNAILNAGGAAGSKNGSTQVSKNSFYSASKGSHSGSGDVSKGSVGEAKHENLCVTTRFFSNPTEKCFSNAQPTSSSPHACTDIGL